MKYDKNIFKKGKSQCYEDIFHKNPSNPPRGGEITNHVKENNISYLCRGLYHLITKER